MREFSRELIPAAPDVSFEAPLWAEGWSVVGLDEAGRGAWAGPVTAAAVILPHDPDKLQQLDGVRDSKQINPANREKLAALIYQVASAWGIGSASNTEIDTLGIINATRLAMVRALEILTPPADYLLLDAIFLPESSIPQIALIKGDQRSISIAAASILAKTHRDAVMVEVARQYPNYGFEHHKGYGTRVHQNNLALFGECNLHRSSFMPIKNLIRINNKDTV
jgi:ribonuclease HII